MNVDQLDPGIVDVVSGLRAIGIPTIDSGDGSKFGSMDGALEFEHVAWESAHIDQLFTVTEELRHIRPDEVWQVEITHSKDTNNTSDFVTTGLAYRVDDL